MRKHKMLRKIVMRSDEEELITLLMKSGVISTAAHLLKEPGLDVFALDIDTLLEIYTPGGVYPKFLFEKNNVVLSFRVNDLQAVVNTLLLKGIAVPDGIQQPDTGYCYCYARLTDGQVIGFHQKAPD
jgi:hypothetical protein